MAAGKQTARLTLSDSEADYEIRVGRGDPLKKPARWIVPGALERATAASGDEIASDANAPYVTEASVGATVKAPRSADAKNEGRAVERPPISSPIVGLLHAAAMEFEQYRLINALIAEVLRRSLVDSRVDASQVHHWAHQVKMELMALDPIPGLLELARSSDTSFAGYTAASLNKSRPIGRR